MGNARKEQGHHRSTTKRLLSASMCDQAIATCVLPALVHAFLPPASSARPGCVSVVLPLISAPVTANPLCFDKHSHRGPDRHQRRSHTPLRHSVSFAAPCNSRSPMLPRVCACANANACTCTCDGTCRHNLTRSFASSLGASVRTRHLMQTHNCYSHSSATSLILMRIPRRSSRRGVPTQSEQPSTGGGFLSEWRPTPSSTPARSGLAAHYSTSAPSPQGVTAAAA